MTCFSQDQVRDVDKDPNAKIMHFVTMTGVNLDTIDFADRKTEYWAVNDELTLNARGKKTNCPGIFFYNDLYKKLDTPSQLRVIYYSTR